MYHVIKSDCRSTTGRNIRRIENIFEGKPLHTISNKDIKKMEYHPIAQEDKWRIPIVKELLEVRYNQLHIQGFDRSEVKEILENICTT